MDPIPKCRENDYRQIVDALLSGIRIISLNGPSSSGKTFTIKSIISREELACNTVHLFCETGMTVKDIIQTLSNSLLDNFQKITTFQAFYSKFHDFKQTVIFLDSFDLLNEEAKNVFLMFWAAVDANLLPQFSFVFISRFGCSTYTSNPIQVFSIDFNSYTVNEIKEIVAAASGHRKTKAFKTIVNRIMKTCEPVTRDLRDIIFITHNVMNVPKLSKMDNQAFSGLILNELGLMKTQEMSRCTDLSKAAAMLLLASYIGSRTGPDSDLLKLSRATARGKRLKLHHEEHEYVNLGRIVAIAKALSYHHTEGFEFDFGISIQLNTLVEYGLIELRGDIRTEAKVKLLAAEEEVKEVAMNLGIDVDNYTAEDL